jgi:hypothetical protein
MGLVAIYTKRASLSFWNLVQIKSTGPAMMDEKSIFVLDREGKGRSEYIIIPSSRYNFLLPHLPRLSFSHYLSTHAHSPLFPKRQKKNSQNKKELGIGQSVCGIKRPNHALFHTPTIHSCSINAIIFS